MKKKDFKDAVLDMIEDYLQIKRDYEWSMPSFEIHDGFIECNYRIQRQLMSIPVSKASEWRMYALNGEIILVLTYHFLTEDK